MNTETSTEAPTTEVVTLNAPPIYVRLNQLAKEIGLPAAYLKRLTDDGKLPYLEPRQHERFYCLLEVQAALSQIAHANMKQERGTPIDFSEFNLRIAKALRSLKIETWEKLAALPKDQLLSEPGIGKGCVKEVERKLQEHAAQPGLFTKEESHATV